MAPPLSRLIARITTAIRLALLAFGLCANAWADNSAVATWRHEADQVRILAENDAPAAYQAAQRLRTTLPADATPADRARLLNLRARVEIYLAQTEAAALHTQQAFDLAKQYGDNVGQAEADLNIALNAINQGRIEAMAAAATHSMTILEGVDRPDLLSEAMLRTAMMYQRTGQLNDANLMALHALEMARRSGNPLALTYAYQGMANSYNSSEQTAKARQYFMLMREQARIAHMRLLEAAAISGLGRTATHRGDFAEGRSLLQESLDIDRKIGAPFSVSFDLFGLAENLRKQGQANIALALLNEIIAIYEKYPNKIGLWWTLNTRSTTYQSLGKKQPAQTDAEHAYQLAQALNFPFYMSESARRLAAIAAAQGHHRLAYQLAAESIAMSAKAVRDNADTRMIELARHYEAESKQRQLNELNLRNEQQTGKLRQDALQQRWLLTLAGSSLIILAVTVFFLRRLHAAHRILENTHTQLQQSQSNQQAILDAIPDQMFEIGLDGRYYDYHTLQPELLATPGEKLIGKTLFDVLPQEAAEICLSALQKANINGTSAGYQFKLPLPQGTRWFELSVAIKSLGGEWEHPRFIVLSRDITERKHMEQALIRRENEYRTLVENMPDMVVRYDPEFRRVLVNPAYYSATGILDGIANGKTLEDIWLPVNITSDEYKASLKRVMETGEPTNILLEWPDPAPERGRLAHDMRIVAEYAADGHVMGVLAIGHDVSELRRMEDMLRERAQEFRTLVENSPDVIIRYDRECRRIYINPAAIRLNGSIGAQVLGKTPSEIFLDKEKAQAYQTMLTYVMDNAIGRDMPLEWPLPDGGQIHLHLRIAPEFNSAGEVRGVLVIGRDMSTAKETELRLQESSTMLRELAARNESVREAERKRIAREIHDELGQMLTGMRLDVLAVYSIFGAGNLLLQDKILKMLKNLDGTLSVVRDIVSALRPSVLNAGIVDALDWLTHEFSRNSGIACNVLTEEEAIALNEAQVTAIFRIVQESLTNVLRHSGADLVEISLTQAHDGKTGLLEIADNGRGFDPDQPRKQKSLGLIGMQERAIMLGGSLAITSTPRGTVLQVYFPISPADVKIKAEEPSL